MDKLDRLGWVAGLTFTAYGVRVGVRTNDPSILDRVRSALPPGSRGSSVRRVDRLFSLTVGGHDAARNLRRFHLLYAEAEQLVRSHELDDVMAALETDLQLHVAEFAPRRVFVHAGVVGWCGRAIVLPGSSHAGKTTLVAALVRAGATYYSDEYAVLDASGRVHPYTRDPRVRGDDDFTRPVALTTFGAAPAGRTPLPVGLVALTHYRAGASWRPRPLSPGQGALGLLAHTVPARLKPDRVLPALEGVMAQAPAWKGTRGEAEETAAWLLDAAARQRQKGGA
jgi:hypothetical protein